MLKPITGTDSVGITKHHFKTGDVPPVGFFYEEFIEGMDLTLHLVRSGKSLVISEINRASNLSSEFLDDHLKSEANQIFGTNVDRHALDGELEALHKSYFQPIITTLEKILPKLFIARIDLRVPDLRQPDSSVFLELNAIPTISHANSWTKTARWLDQREGIGIWQKVENLPLHSAAKSLSVFLECFYVQSLSMQTLKPFSL